MSQPTQYGEDADSARKCGTYWAQRVDDRDRLLRRPDADVHVHAEDLQPPGQPLHLARPAGGSAPWARSSWVCQSVIGWVPAHISAQARARSAAAATSASVPARSALASATVRADAGDDLDRRLQQLVLGLGVLLGAVRAASPRGSRRRPAVSSRVSRSTSCSSHSTPRLARSEDWKGICTCRSLGRSCGAHPATEHRSEPVQAVPRVSQHPRNRSHESIAALAADDLTTALGGPHDVAVVMGSGWAPAADAFGAAAAPRRHRRAARVRRPDRGRPRRRGALGAGRRPQGAALPRPHPPLRGPRRRPGRARRAHRRRRRREDRRPHQRRRRAGAGPPGRPGGAHRRPPQPDRPLAAGRRQLRRPHRPLLRRGCARWPASSTRR